MSLGIQTSRVRRVAHRATTIDGLPVIARKGKVYFFDGSRSANGNGESWADAANNMQSLFDKLVGGETIFVAGRVAEQLVTPAQIFDVSIIGVGNRPRHADSTPSGGNTYASQWAGGGLTAAQANLRIIQQGWRVENILFSMVDANAAGIELVRNAGSGDDERDASHAIIYGCKFAGAGVGVRGGVAGSFTEQVHNALIENCTFLTNTTGIRQTSGFLAVNWQIKDNDFITCTNDIVGPFSGCKIVGNRFSLAPTAALVLTGGGTNGVHGNYLPGTYEAGTVYAAGTSDSWMGNYSSVDATTSPAGLTVAAPD